MHYTKYLVCVISFKLHNPINKDYYHCEGQKNEVIFLQGDTAVMVKPRYNINVSPSSSSPAGLSMRLHFLSVMPPQR